MHILKLCELQTMHKQDSCTKHINGSCKESCFNSDFIPVQRDRSLRECEIHELEIVAYKKVLAKSNCEHKM